MWVPAARQGDGGLADHHEQPQGRQVSGDRTDPQADPRDVPQGGDAFGV